LFAGAPARYDDRRQAVRTGTPPCGNTSHAEDGGTGGGELDRQRKTVELLTNVRHDQSVGILELEFAQGRGHAFDEQFERRESQERPQPSAVPMSKDSLAAKADGYVRPRRATALDWSQESSLQARPARLPW